MSAGPSIGTCHIRTANDFREHQDEARRAYLSVKGCGPVTRAYLRMLTNVDDVKADTWIKRYVHDKVPDMQFMAVAAGGSLAQHLPDVVGHARLEA